MEYAQVVHKSNTAAYKTVEKNGILKNETERNKIMACGVMEQL
jgi:hypothetical protein